MYPSVPVAVCDRGGVIMGEGGCSRQVPAADAAQIEVVVRYAYQAYPLVPMLPGMRYLVPRQPERARIRATGRARGAGTDVAPCRAHAPRPGAAPCYEPRAAAIEFALIVSLLLMLLTGIVGYGAASSGRSRSWPGGGRGRAGGPCTPCPAGRGAAEAAGGGLRPRVRRGRAAGPVRRGRLRADAGRLQPQPAADGKPAACAQVRIAYPPDGGWRPVAISRSMAGMFPGGDGLVPGEPVAQAVVQLSSSAEGVLFMNRVVAQIAAALLILLALERGLD